MPRTVVTPFATYRNIKFFASVSDIWGVRQMAMHLGQARHQILTAGLDDLHALGGAELPTRPHGDDPSVIDHDGLVFEDTLAIHRQHIDVDEARGRHRRACPARHIPRLPARRTARRKSSSV